MSLLFPLGEGCDHSILPGLVEVGPVIQEKKVPISLLRASPG